MKDYQISRNRLMELRYFCRQYNEWKDLCEAIDGFPRANFSREGFSQNISDPVVRCVEKRDIYRRKMELIENAAKLAGGKYSDILLETVTGNTHHKIHKELFGRFFFILDKTRK